MIELLKSWDTDLFLTLNGANNTLLDFLMWWASDKIIWLPLYMFFLVIIIKEFKWKSIWILISIIILITLSDQISVKLFKEVFERLRPCHEPALDGLVHIVKGKCGGSFGFVSSHATNAFAFATFLIALLNPLYKKIYIIILIWALLVGYSRIYLGVHYPGDVIVGAILGFFIGKSVHYIVNKFVLPRMGH